MRALLLTTLFLLLVAVPDAEAEPRADIVALMDSVRTENLDETVHHLEAYGTAWPQWDRGDVAVGEGA